ncbi:MAG: ATP-grasp domain-containing protein [Streptosporangiaceae bacterium]
MTTGWFVLVESNTTGSGRLFCDRARKLGLVPVMLARDPGRYRYVRQDAIDCQVADTADPDALLAACARLGGPVAGVTSSSEYFIGIAAQVAGSLGLPHPDTAAIACCRDKHAQRARLRQAGLPSPAFVAAGHAQDAIAAARRIGLPVVVKPVAGSGSVGVRLCRSLAEVAAAASHVLGSDPAVLGLPPQASVLVEELLDGPEYSAEVLATELFGITRKWLGPLPHFVEIGHDFPAPLPPAERTSLGEAALAGLRAVGLISGAAHVELRSTANGPVIVEINPRLAGGMIPRAVQEATGIDMIQHLVAQAAGMADAPAASRSRAASIRFLTAHAAGRLEAVTGLDKARRLPSVIDVGLTCEIGQLVQVRHSFSDRLGYVIAAADDGPAAARAAETGLAALEARIAPANAARARARVQAARP